MVHIVHLVVLEGSFWLVTRGKKMVLSLWGQKIPIECTELMVVLIVSKSSAIDVCRDDELLVDLIVNPLPHNPNF